MPSTITQAVQTRIPNELADSIRRQAEENGQTFSAALAAVIRSAAPQALHRASSPSAGA